MIWSKTEIFFDQIFLFNLIFLQKKVSKFQDFKLKGVASTNLYSSKLKMISFINTSVILLGPVL